MRQVTATEKYRAVLEGKMAKKEFVRQMRQTYPTFISNFDGFDSTVQILKNKQMLFEAPQKAFSGVKVYDDRPALTYSLDALDRGVRIELKVLGLDPATDFINKENLDKATNKAKDNLEKDANHYLNLMSGESSKVDKHDKEKEVKRGAQDKDTFNDMKKATLKENKEEEEIELNTDADFEREQRAQLDARNEDISLQEKKDIMVQVVNALRAKYPDITGSILKDFIRTHYEDIIGGADIESEFEEYIYANYETAADMRESDVNELSGDAIDALIGLIGAGGLVGGAAALSKLMSALESGKLGDKGKAVAAYLAKAGSAAASSTQKHETKGKDHDGDGDIDSDDYMIARDKAIKKAMGKDPKEEQLKEAIKSIIKKTLLNEAATVKLADWAESYETFPGVKPVVNELENIVTEIETFYDKMGDKIKNVFEKTADFENEEGLKIGGFIAPGLESAFRQDLSKVIKKGSFFNKIDLPKVRTITQADVDAHNSGERPLGETDVIEEPKTTVFTPNF